MESFSFSVPDLIFYLLPINCTNKKGQIITSENACWRSRATRIYQIAQSRDGDRGSRGSLQGSSIVSILGFLPSFSFKNKTRGAVDNACRCASVIIKSRRTRGPVTLIPTSGVLRTRRRCRRRSRLSTSGWCFLSKNAFPRGGLTGLSSLLACFSQGRETMRGTQQQETESGEEGA